MAFLTPRFLFILAPMLSLASSLPFLFLIFLAPTFLGLVWCSWRPLFSVFLSIYFFHPLFGFFFLLSFLFSLFLLSFLFTPFLLSFLFSLFLLFSFPSFLFFLAPEFFLARSGAPKIYRFSRPAEGVAAEAGGEGEVKTRQGGARGEGGWSPHSLEAIAFISSFGFITLQLLRPAGAVVRNHTLLLVDSRVNMEAKS